MSSLTFLADASHPIVFTPFLPSVPPTPPRCEVAFTSQSGACLCGLPLRCGAAASAATAAAAEAAADRALPVDAGGA